MTMKSKTRDKGIKKGTTILTETPFVFVLNGKLHSERCDYCFSRADLKQCTGCSFSHYCGRECQKKGWFYHKRECTNIKRVSPYVVPDSVRMLGRIIIRLERGGAHERSFYSKTKFRVFKDLMSHYNEIKNDTEKMEHFAVLEALLEKYLGRESLPNTAELLGLYGRMVINTFNILDIEMQSIGSGLYLAASVIDHSCTPNAVAVFEGTTLNIRTLKNLSSENWSDIYISYIDILNLPSKRQKELETMYYFLCQCQKCLDIKELKDMTSVICQNKECGNVIPGGASEIVSACAKCNQEISNEALEKIKEVINFTEVQLENMKDTIYLDICRMCLDKQEGLLYNTNIYNVKVLDMAVESCIAIGNWQDALMYGLRVKEHLCELHPLYGLFLMKLGKIALLLEKLDDANKLLLEAENILNVTHGEKLLKQLHKSNGILNGSYTFPHLELQSEANQKRK